MFILFVSDIHLCNKRPYVIECFLRFLYHYAIRAKALYILGDLFEIWIGDDDPNPLHKQVSNALKYLHQHHILCYFIHGNHDFLLGKKYATTCGITVLPSQEILNFLGYKIVLLHGDILCINDNIYHFFRKYSRNILLQKLFLSLPLSTRLHISSLLKNKKKKHSINTILNLDQEKIKKILHQTKTEIMIHGHIHQPSIHYKIVNKTKKIERAVLGAWTHKGSAIKINQRGIYLMEFFL